MIKSIVLASVLFAAPAGAQAKDSQDLTIVKALVNMVSAEEICGLKMNPALVEYLVNGLQYKSHDLGSAIRQKGLDNAIDILERDEQFKFCDGMRKTLQRFGY